VRHRNARTKLNRSATHRRAMQNNMLVSLIEHGRVKTTVRRARDLRRIAERTITRATRLGDLLLADPDKLDAEGKAQLIHAMRLVRRRVKDREAVAKVFEDWAPRYLGRPGGYTRVFKLGRRQGDNAPMALVELIPAELPEREGAAPKKERKKRGLLSRLRRGGK